MNKVCLIGRLTKDVELKPLENNAVASFTLAVNRAYKKGEADFIPCKIWGKRAEALAQYTQKGRQIAVYGEIRTGSYEAQDGTRRYTTEVLALDFEFLGLNGSNENNSRGSDFGGSFSQPDQNFYGDNSFGGNGDMTPVDDGSIPF